MEKVKKIIPALVEDFVLEGASSFDFIDRKIVMLKEIKFCYQTGNLVGVYSKILGNGMFLLGVEQIVYGIDSELVIFHAYDMSGYKLPTRTILLAEIDMIVPFNNRYVRPQGLVSSKALEVSL